MGMKKIRTAIAMAVCGVLAPFLATAQVAGEIRSLHQVLDRLYDEMMPLCTNLISVGSGLAGFAALWYIAARVWKHLANAEPIDFYPLLRPFAIGFCLLNFTLVLGLINGVMKPTVTATAAMVEGSDRAIRTLLDQREQAVKDSRFGGMYGGFSNPGDREKWLKYTQDIDADAPAPDEGFWERIGNDFKFAFSKFSFNMRNSIKAFMAEVLRILFEAAALCINTLRTFQLVVLSVLGPLVFGLAVFDGFQHTLTIWLARYINIFLWLPVANIFGSILGKIQENMLRLDLAQIGSAGDTTFTSMDTGYLIFMVIDIIGYFTVPSVANYIVHAAAGGALPHRTSSVFGSIVRTSATMGTAAAVGGAAMVLKGGAMTTDAMGDAASGTRQSMADQATTSGYFKDKIKGNS